MAARMTRTRALALHLIVQILWVQSASLWPTSALLRGTQLELELPLRTIRIQYPKANSSVKETSGSSAEPSNEKPLVQEGTEGDRQTILDIESRFKGSKIFICHPGFSHLARALFPDAPLHDISSCRGPVAALMNSAGKCDVIIRGYDQACGCRVNNYPGVIISRNGEPQYISDDKPIAKNGHIYIGPTQREVLPHRRQFFNAQFVSLGPEYARLITGPSTPANVVSVNRRFLAYRSSKCVRHREEAFETIAKMIETTLRHEDVGDALGNCYGRRKDLHVKPKGSGSDWNNIDYMKNRYRFALTMEKVNEIGYISEKILVGFAVGSIPIYYGSPEVFDLFNKEAFIYYDPKDPKPALERILHLETNATAFEEMLAKPKVAHGARETYFSLKKDIGGGGLRAHMLADILSVCKGAK